MLRHLSPLFLFFSVASVQSWHAPLIHRPIHRNRCTMTPLHAQAQEEGKEEQELRRAAEELRKEGFLMADPNGNGLCSLAELETFALKKLIAAFPKKNKTDPDVGRNLFDAFRPCYIRAFTDAKDYKADKGDVIAGTKNATDDDFVSWEEFRFFNVYLIIYSAMFDAFAKRLQCGVQSSCHGANLEKITCECAVFVT